MEKLSDVKYKIRLRLYRNDLMFGTGVAALLETVDRTGSLSAACRQMGMSYSKGWKIIRRAEQDLGFKLLSGHIGGTGGGSAELTEDGREFLHKFQQFEKELDAEADRIFRKLFVQE